MKKIIFFSLFLLCFSTLKAQIPDSTITVSWDTVGSMCDPVIGAWYEVLGAAAQENPWGYPVYIQYHPHNMDLWVTNGYIYLPNGLSLFPIQYNVLRNQITYFEDGARGNYIKDITNNDGLIFGENTIRNAIEMTVYSYAANNPQWQLNEWTNARIVCDTPITDVQLIVNKFESGCIVGVPPNGYLYYNFLERGAQMYVGEGTGIVWLHAGMHDSIVFGKYNILGANTTFATDQGLGIATYYIDLGMHDIMITGDSCAFDSSYIHAENSTTILIGSHTKFNKKNLALGNQVIFSVGDSSLIEGNISVGNCAYLKAGRHFHNTGNISIEDFVYPVFKDNVTLPGGTIRRDGSTIQLAWNVGSDASPDADSLYKWSNSTITCDSSSISLTSIDHLRSNCYYEYLAAAGKSVTFVNGSFFKMIGGGITLTGSNGDRILFKTNSDGTAAYMINSSVY